MIYSLLAARKSFMPPRQTKTGKGGYECRPSVLREPCCRYHLERFLPQWRWFTHLYFSRWFWTMANLFTGNQLKLSAGLNFYFSVVAQFGGQLKSSVTQRKQYHSIKPERPNYRKNQFLCRRSNFCAKIIYCAVLLHFRDFSHLNLPVLNFGTWIH